MRLQRHDPIGFGEGSVRQRGVARLPFVDPVVGLPFLLVPDHRGTGGHRLLGRDDGRQRLVVDLDQLQRVFRDVPVGGDDSGHFLALVAHLVGDQHRLGVARQRRHPGQVVLGHELAGDDRDDAVDRGRGRGVDAAQARVGQRRPQNGHVQHAREHQVVQEVALAFDQPGVLVAVDPVADAPDLGRRAWHRLGVRLRLLDGCHWTLPAAAAAVLIDSTMFM